MIGFGIAYGLIGSMTIGMVSYMIVHGYPWWQVAGIAILGYVMLPMYKQRNGEP